MTDSPSELKIKLQVLCGDEIAMGPGKAELLEAIDGNGSISAAARTLGMSYRRAWMLVDTMNRCWTTQVVETAPGGAARGGARLTSFGRRLLGFYRGLEGQAADVRENPDWAALRDMLRPSPKEHQ